MYWLNLASLKDELAQGPLPQAHAFQYALADAVITCLARGGNAPWWDVIAAMAVTALGTAYCFEANGGADGRDFIARFVSLGWVVGLRLGLACIVPAMLAAIAIAAFYAGGDAATAESSPAVSALGLLGLSAIYWRIGVHLANIRRRSATVPA